MGIASAAPRAWPACLPPPRTRPRSRGVYAFFGCPRLGGNLFLSNLEYVGERAFVATNIENIYASIIVNSRRNKAKIIFDLDSSYLKIIEILNKEKEEIINDLKKIDELRKLSRNYKTALLDLKYNEKVMPKTIDFIKNNFGNIPNDKKVKALNELDYYGKETKRI